MSDNWVKIEAQSWEPEKEKEVVGVLLSIQTDVGKFKSTMATLRKADGSEVAVWANRLLADKLKGREGSEVRIVFTGEQKGKNFETPYKTYDVFHRPAPEIRVEEAF